MKRTIALLLTLATLLSVLPATFASADDTPRIVTVETDPREKGITHKEYLQLLKDEAEQRLFTAGGRGEPYGAGIVGGVIKTREKYSYWGTENGYVLDAKDWDGLSDSVKWELKDGVLTLSGEGPMAIFSENEADGPAGFPFYNNPYVETLVVEEGVTEVRIGYCKLPNLKTAIIMDASSMVYLNANGQYQPQLDAVLYGANLKKSPLTSCNGKPTVDSIIFLTDQINGSRPTGGYVSEEYGQSSGNPSLYNILPWDDLLTFARSKLEGVSEEVLAKLPDELTSGPSEEVTPLCTVTYNAGGGTASFRSKTVTRGEPYGEFPSVENGNKYFVGWFTTPRDGGEQVDENSLAPFETSVMLYARWGSDPTPDEYTITINDTPETIEQKRQKIIDENSGTATYRARLASMKNFIAGNFNGKGEEAYIYTWVTDDVRAMSNQICAGLSGDREKVQAIHDWVCDNIYYHQGGPSDGKPAQRVLDDRYGVCNGYASLMQALCWAQKIPAIIVDGGTDGAAHAWNLIKVDGQWLWLDATWDSYNKYKKYEGFVKGDTRQNYFLCSDEYMAVGHEAQYVSMSVGYNISPAMDYAILFKQRSPETYSLTADIDHELVEEVNDIRDEFGLRPVRRSGSTILYPYDESRIELYLGIAESRLKGGLMDSWAYDEVTAALKSYLIPPRNNTDLTSAFKKNITREQFCDLMVNMVEESVGMSASGYLKKLGKEVVDPFDDTDADCVLYAYAMGIVGGYGDGTFLPGASIQREEAAAMLTRTAKFLGANTADAKGVDFADAARCSDWAKGSIAYVSATVNPENGKAVMQGVGNDMFDPNGSYTIEQAILTVYRLYGALK